MNRAALWLLGALALALPLGAQEKTVREPAALRAFFTNHCVDCHAADEPEGGFDLETMASSPEAAIRRLARARRRVFAGEMPPPDASDLEAKERDRLLDQIEDAILALDAKAAKGPGRVTVRRLSRTEYRHAARDLFGVGCDAADAFPADDLGYGFDNIGDALSTSTLHVEKYLAAAEEIARRTIDVEDPDNPSRRRIEAEFMKLSFEGAGQGDHANLYKRGHVEDAIAVSRPGRYRFRVTAWGDQAGDEAPRLVLSLDGKEAASFAVEAERDEPKVYECELSLENARADLRLAFTNDFYDPKNPNKKRRDRNLHLDWVEIVGPLDRREPTVGQAWILAADPGRGKTARRLRPILEVMGRRLWRRPLATKERRRLESFLTAEIDGGLGFRSGLRLALQAMLVSPHYLFRIEPGGKTDRRGEGLELDDWQIATRLSFFLWSSVPDERLLKLAEKKRLRRPDVLVAEATRMLEDPRARALAENFAAQWLELKNLDVFEPDPDRFVPLDDALRDDLREEAEALVLHVLRSKAPVSELLTARYGFLNERLARHYGIKGVRGDEFRRVTFKDEERGGLLSQGAMLAVTSNPTRTSIVKRGKWVLENLLDAAPPAPPPGADSLGDEAAIDSAASLRERMLAHRADPACASCHERMDALGFALEGFDVVGRKRGGQGAKAIDTSGSLPDGRTIEGVVGLRKILAADPAFPAAVAKKLFVYGVGRDAGPADEVRLIRMTRAAGPDVSLSELVLGIVQSQAFRMRSAER